MIDKLMSLGLLAMVTLLFPVIWAVTSRDAPGAAIPCEPASPPGRT
ncbi:hypothetical protein [Azospirillum sp. ST 5-10]